MILLWRADPVPILDFYNIVFTFPYKTYILDKAQMIVKPNRKDMAEQHSYAEIPDTETLMKIVYLGFLKTGSGYIFLCNSSTRREISRQEHDKYFNLRGMMDTHRTKFLL